MHNKEEQLQRSRHFHTLGTWFSDFSMGHCRASCRFLSWKRGKNWRVQSSFPNIASVPHGETSSSSSFKEEPSSPTQIDDTATLCRAETIPTLLQPSLSQPESLNHPVTFPLTATHLATHTEGTRSGNANANNTFTDQDSTFEWGGSDRSLSMTSVSSSIYEGEVENGRRYGSFPGATYHIPDDERQQEVEAMTDHLWKVVMRGSLFLSPIEAQLHKVLDIGTGTGGWSEHMGDAHPHTHVCGVDISPIQPNWVPQNVEFILDNVELPWMYPQKFDLVHIRNMTTSIKNWDSLLKNSYASLKPSGWLELQEIHYIPQFKNGAFKSAAQPLADFYSTITKGFKELEIDLGITPFLADKVRRAGYVNIEEQVYSIPISSDTGNEAENEYGRLLKQIILDGLDGFALRALTRGLRWRGDEVEAWLAGPRSCLEGELKDAFVQMHVICAQRQDNTD